MRTLKKRSIYLLLDCLAVNVAAYISLLLKFDLYIPERFTDKLWMISTVLTMTSALVYYVFGLYNMLWIYASIEELIHIFFATLTGILSQAIIFTILQVKFPITLYLINWLLTFFLIGGLRLSSRLLKKLKILNKQSSHQRRAMIIGAGEAASIIIKEMKNNKHSVYTPIVAIDDDNRKHKTRINGIPVIGGRDKIVWAVKEMQIHEIIIAIPSISRCKTAEIIKICKQTSCKVKVLPSVYSIVNGEVSIKKIRDVTVEDLLQREEISLSVEEISGYLNHKTILVTGGGGSIGSELCRQLAVYQPKQLLIFDIYENNAYDLQNELQQKFKDELDIRVLIGSIQDKKRIESIFIKYQPNIIFHAAAHKHVPLMEANPQEAVKNNIFGTLCMAQCADKFHCEKFVLISTDKAVNPTSIMGATKRAAELIIQNMNQLSRTKFCAVRFGNVLGSNGSVIPLFKKQIEYGGPISITHPEVTRYFMTIPEAASLVIQSGAMMEGGEIFVLDMGDPVKIIDLANSLITLSGLKPNIDIEIEYVGLRPGEKLYEELLIEEEKVEITKNNKIFVEKQGDAGTKNFIQLLGEVEPSGLDDRDDIIEFIKKLVPSYQGNQ